MALFSHIYPITKYFKHHLSFSLKLILLYQVSSFHHSKISHLYSNNSLALKILLHALQPLLVSIRASESAQDVWVQQYSQHSLMWFFSALKYCRLCLSQNSPVNACYNWWGVSLLGCRRWPLCILVVGGLFCFVPQKQLVTVNVQLSAPWALLLCSEIGIGTGS